MSDFPSPTSEEKKLPLFKALERATLKFSHKKNDKFTKHLLDTVLHHDTEFWTNGKDIYKNDVKLTHDEVVIALKEGLHND